MNIVETDETQENGLRQTWQLVRKRFWLIVAVYGVITLTAGIDTLQQQPVYQATAQLLIEDESPNIIPFEEAVGKEYVSDTAVSDSSYYQTQYKVLQSRSLARRVIQTLQLHKNPVFTTPAPPSILQTLRGLPNRAVSTSRHWLRQLLGPDHPLQARPPLPAQAAPEAALVGNFLSRLHVRPVAKTRLVEVSFTAPDPQLAAKVANTTARIYIDQNLQMRFAASQTSVDWLHQRVQEMRNKVEESELALQRYKETNEIISLEERQNVTVQQLAALNTALTQANTNFIGIDTLYQQIQQAAVHPELLEAMPSVVNNAFVQSLKKSYASLQYTIAELEDRWGPRHRNMLQRYAKLDALEKQIKQEVQKVTHSVKMEYESEKARVKGLREAFEKQKKESLILNKKVIQYTTLKREIESNRQLYDILLNNMKKTGISMELKRNNIRMVDAAEVSTGAIAPNLVATLTRASMISLVLGVGLAFLLDFLDMTIKTPEEAETLLQLPILGTVGYFTTSKRKLKEGETGLIISQQPRSQPAEAFKTCCTNLLLDHPETPCHVLLITSPNPQDGKTTVAANLAVGMAKMGRRVLLIDADLRHPSLHNLFGLPDCLGLSALLLQEDITAIAVPNVVEETLSFLPAGSCPPNPLALLGSKRMQRVIELAREQYEIVIIDTPPALAVSDALILSPLVDGLIAVLRCSATSRSHAKRLIKQLIDGSTSPSEPPDQNKWDNHKVLGLFMNFLQPREQSAYYSYGYNAYYQNDSEDDPQELVSNAA